MKKVMALLVAIIFVLGVALVRTATANHNSEHKSFSGGATFKGLIVKTNRAVVGITVNQADGWQTVDSRGFQLPAGESQLVVVDFSASSLCSSTSSDDECRARVVVGRTLATAQELEPVGGVTMDSHSDDQFESHSFSQALCVRNNTASPLDISVWLQAARSGDGAITYLIADSTLKIARNAPCDPAVNI